MQTVFAQMSVSLDGYVAGPGDGPDNPLGDRGEIVHEWMIDTAAFLERHGGRTGGRRDRESELLAESIARTGATVMGRRMFDNGEEPWGPEPPFRHPVFVVTHRAREPLVRDGGTTFHFVTDGIERALEQARAAAGERDVEIGGGADIVQQYLLAGLLDELEIHLAPVFLGGGVRLFDRPELAGRRLGRTRVVDSPGATHARFEVGAS
jgi:dihydrofolate reductase